jgi:endoglucanase
MVVLAALVLAAVPLLARPASAAAGVSETSASARAAVAGVAGAVSRVATVARSRAATRARRARGARSRAVVVRPPNPFAALPQYVDPRSPARAQTEKWSDSRPADAALLERIAGQPQAIWLGDWIRDVRAEAAARTSAARAAGALPLLVAYNIPERDCGLHSGGGTPDGAAYLAWIDALARGIGSAPAAVVLEPDALAGLNCLDGPSRRERLRLLAAATGRLAQQPGVAVYIDAGNPTWVPAPEIARRLRAAGIARARGFAVNVSSFSTTAASRDYGRVVSRRVGGAPFIIDTGRNGAGPAPDDAWCNPPGRALGESPTAATGDRLIDAFVWVKRPGESDGTCNGGPPAGEWWPDYALGLVRAAGA